jgi:hypothetical protein
VSIEDFRVQIELKIEDVGPNGGSSLSIFNLKFAIFNVHDKLKHIGQSLSEILTLPFPIT